MKKILILFLFTISLMAQPKKIYFFGDSITNGGNLTNAYPILVANALGMTLVNHKQNAVGGTTMMTQTPSCLVDCRSMEYRVDTNQIPIYNSATDGLLFVAYLTNDVGINYTNYNIENFGKAIDKIIQALYKAGWNKDNIKFNVRYFITNDGLSKYPLSGNYGKFTASTIEKYNAFAELLRNKLDEQGIQYFDHYDLLNAIPDALTHLPDKVHPDAYFHSIIAKNIIDNIKLPTLSINNFELDNTFKNVQYFNLLGQKVKETKGIVIIKAEKNGIVYTKKIML